MHSDIVSTRMRTISKCIDTCTYLTSSDVIQGGGLWGKEEHK